MMVKPSINTLLKRVDSRYTLVSMAAKRARMIGAQEKEEDESADFECIKPVSMAVDEIADGKVGYIRSESIRRVKEWEAEKQAAILALNDNRDAFEDINREVKDVISEPIFGETVFKSPDVFPDED